MSLFGEVQLGNSRAISDDEDDEFSMVNGDQTLKRRIYWIDEKEVDNKMEVDELIIADGPNSSAFVYTFLISHLKDANVKVLGLNATLSQYKVFQQNHESKETLKFEQFEASCRSNYIYYIDSLNGKKVAICQFYEQLRSNELYDWIRQLTERIDFAKALVFCSQNKSQYLGSELRTPFVRYLSSDKSQDSNKMCTRLEEPNFIGSLPAAVVTYCVAKKLDFTTFVCYTPSLIADIQSVKEMFNAASTRLKGDSHFINNDSSQKTLLSVGNIFSSVSALYM